MQCWIYKSPRRPGTYVYLRERDAFALLPAAPSGSLGALEFVLELALTPELTLARADVRVVLANLEQAGFHLQFPPDDPIAARGY
jgi:uncharacterized protein YcgL (UPF0745 family)